MKVHFTRNARDNLGVIYDYHTDYSIEYADKFYDEITVFIGQILSEYPEIGTVYNQAKNLRRLVFDKGYNIYYLNENNVAYVLYIIDTKLYLNEELQNPDIELPELL